MADRKPSWKMFEHGTLVFEQPPAAEGGAHRLLVCRTESCSERKCSCRDVRLGAIGLELGCDAASNLTHDTFRALLNSGRLMRAAINIDAGYVEPDDHEGRTPLTDDWVDYLESEIDGELLDLFQERWLAAKGWRPRTWQEATWPTQDPNEMVAWRELHPDDRKDFYFLDEGLFAATELYCPNPVCTCTEARVAFTELLEKGDDLRSVGSVRVRLPAIEVLEREASSKDRAILDELWNAYRVRHRRISERLGSRRDRVMEIGKARAAAAQVPAATQSTRVGRNDPCPCGSGKKYKQCCLGSPAPGQPS